jgi:integrase
MAYVCEVSGLYPRNGGILCFKYKTLEGDWKEKSTRERKERAARKFQRDFQHQMETGTMPNDISEWRLDKAEEWVKEHRLNRIAQSTQNSEAYRYQHLRRVIGNKKLKDITNRDLSRYQDKRLEEEVGPDSINKEIRLWSLVLREAKVWRFLRDDYKPLKTQASEVGQALTRDELKTLVTTAATNDDWTVALLAATLAANIGLRGGEIKRLKLSQVDLVNSQLRIKRHAAAERVRKEGVKTDAGVRVVPLNIDARDAVKRLHERYELLRAKARVAEAQEHHLLPLNLSRITQGKKKGGRGYRFTEYQKSWDTSWASLTDKAGFPDLRFHDLRHTFISHMVERGIPIERIMAMVGHISARMVRHYTHVATGVLHKDVAVLDSEPILTGWDAGIPKDAARN